MSGVVNTIFITIILGFTLHANVYEQNCVPCHAKQSESLEKMFYRYLLRYSSRANVKLSLYTYLKEPQQNLSIMPQAYIKKYGVMPKSTLNSEQLKEAVDIYWQRFDIKNKLY